MQGDLGPGDSSATRDSAGCGEQVHMPWRARWMRGQQTVGAAHEDGPPGARSGGEALVPVVQAVDLWQGDYVADLG